ncbi:hypothetical protein GGU11DRAFT_821200 [Lentinula aff. detonsa]|nr:hypothetical protein GGU11DRAFT_821200 [Lentinula aff. detonsa]
MNSSPGSYGYCSDSPDENDDNSGWRSGGVGVEDSESEDCSESNWSESEAGPGRSRCDERVCRGPESEWDDSRHVLEEIRYGCSPLVLLSIQNSIQDRAIYALPNERHGRGNDVLRGRGLHNEMNVEHFGLLKDPVQHKFGDPLSEQLEYLLVKSSPYPSEDGDEYGAVDRFCAVQISPTEHLLIDSTGDGAEYVLHGRVLQDPDFRPVEWYLRERGLTLAEHPWAKAGSMGDPRGKRVSQILNAATHYPGTDLPYFIGAQRHLRESKRSRFTCFLSESKTGCYVIDDALLDLRWPLATALLEDPRFNIYRWYCKHLVELYQTFFSWRLWDDSDMLYGLFNSLTPERNNNGDSWDLCLRDRVDSGWNDRSSDVALQVNGIQIPKDQYTGLQRNAAMVKDPGRKIARPIVIVVRINGHPVTALIDSGSLGTFMSTALIDQLKFEEVHMDHPLTLQLAVQGSHSKINRQVIAHFEYQGINEERVTTMPSSTPAVPTIIFRYFDFIIFFRRGAYLRDPFTLCFYIPHT